MKQSSLIKKMDKSHFSPTLPPHDRRADDQVWVDVVQKMEEMYSDLVNSQVELEQKHTELEEAHKELQSTQKQLVQSEKMASLGKLVAGVAHELNNPISFLYANMHALLAYQKKFSIYIDAVHGGVIASECNKLRQDLRIDKMMNDIAPLVEGSMEGAERVSQIVANLKKFSTPQGQKFKTFNIIQVIETAISWVLKANSMKVEVQRDYPDYLELFNNEGHIHQILINLINNAFDAMQKSHKPALAIRIKQDRQFAHIHIIDNGAGINKTDVIKIFDPFYTTKAVGDGTGLGLSISYGLATKQCKGNLIAKPHHRGGAEFIFSLPLKNPHATV